MKLLSFRQSAYLLIGALLALPAVAAVPCSSPTSKLTASRAEAPDEASMLIQRIRNESRDIRDNAAVLQSLIREAPLVDWRVHADLLEQVRDEVNSMGADFCQLQAIRSESLPWQKRVMRQIRPEVVELAAYTEHAIDFVHQENLGNYASPDYTIDVNALYQKANRVETTTNDFVEYAKARQEMRELRRDMQSKVG